MRNKELAVYGTKPKTLTTRELAVQLGTDKKVIIENARKYLPNKRFEHGRTAFWTEEEITVLIEGMRQNNSNQYKEKGSVTGAVTDASTSLTPALKIKKALELIYEEELRRLEAMVRYSEASGRCERLELAHIVSRGADYADIEESWNIIVLTHDEHRQVQHQKGWDVFLETYPHLRGRVEKAREMAGKLPLKKKQTGLVMEGNMTDIKIFNNAYFGQVRTLVIANEPWFVGKDVATALGYGEGKSLANAIANHVDQDDKGVTKIMTPGGKQDMVIINESGMYSLVLSSKLEGAKKFKKWVTSEVLPSIRKNGVYATDKMIHDIVENPDLGIELFTRLKEERAARLKAEQTNAILMHVKKTYTASEIAKELGMRSAIELNKWLEEKGIQYKVNDTWLPKAEYADRGFFDIKQDVLDNGHVIYHRRITQLGREFILELSGSVA